MNSTTTVVVAVTETQAKSLQNELIHAGYQLRDVDHAWFQAQGEGVTATCYRSGKLVLQGRGLDFWQERFLGEVQPNPVTAEQKEMRLPAEYAGSDEAGKGDTFGPLVVCAVVVNRAQEDFLHKIGVADSKRLSDERARQLAPTIRDRLDCEERVLNPAEYNRGHRASGSNVNRLLTSLHCDVLQALVKKSKVRAAVVDRFGSNLPVQRQFSTSHPQVKIHEVPKAERFLAVAAASVLARERFVHWFEQAAEHWAVDFALGSGAPAERSLQNFLRIHSAADLPQVAKVHFRNVQRRLGHL